MDMTVADSAAPERYAPILAARIRLLEFDLHAARPRIAITSAPVLSLSR